MYKSSVSAVSFSLFYQVYLIFASVLLRVHDFICTFFPTFIQCFLATLLTLERKTNFRPTIAALSRWQFTTCLVLATYFPICSYFLITVACMDAQAFKVFLIPAMFFNLYWCAKILQTPNGIAKSLFEYFQNGLLYFCRKQNVSRFTFALIFHHYVKFENLFHQKPNKTVSHFVILFSY